MMRQIASLTAFKGPDAIQVRQAILSLMQEQGGDGADVGIIDMGDSQVFTGYSKAFWPLQDRTLKLVTATLTVPGLTDTVADVVKGGVSLAALTIPAGEKVAVIELAEAFTATDDWQMRVTAAGTNALGATFYGRFV